jgi:hypothetical protein
VKKQIMAVIVGSVTPTAAFAVGPAANPMALSDSQMDVVTAGTNSIPTKPATTTVTQVTQTQGDTTNVSTAGFDVEPAANPMARSGSQMDVVTTGTNSTPTEPTTTVTRITQTQGDTTNVSVDRTVRANVRILNFGWDQNVGAYNPQSGGTQVVR